MDKFINIVIPMAGSGSRFTDVGYQDPKPLIDLFGKPMIENVINNLIPKNNFKFIFICQEVDFKSYNLRSIFNRIIGSNWDYVTTSSLSDGPASTVMLAKDLLEDSSELIVANSDQIIDADITEFINDARKDSSDGYIMTFPANEDRWSYAKIDDYGNVKEVAEKKIISTHATVGIYYFKSSKLFKFGYHEMVSKNLRVNGEFYVAPIYNELCLDNKMVKIWEIEKSKMHGIGTPQDLEIFCKKNDGYISKSSPLK